MAAKKKAKYPAPTIIIDTREKQPFEFKWATSHGQIAGTEVKKIDAGDYTVLETPNVVTVERKKTVGELYNNLVGKDKYERFLRELERMQAFEHRYIVVEEYWDALWDRDKFKFARRNRNWAGAMVLTHLIHLQSDYNVHVHFAGDYAEQLTLKLLVKNYERAMKKAS
jgi:ERCC4-type nuclease